MTENHDKLRRRRLIPAALLTILVIGTGLAAWASAGSSTTSQPGPEGVTVWNVPDLAPAPTSSSGQPIDGITCRTVSKETVRYHVHVYVSIYVDGRQERLPAGIGITTPRLVEHTSRGVFYDVGLYDCLYWLHTHANDGIIHVEAPTKGLFTLGQFFDIWGQPLSASQVGPDRGNVVVFENGRTITGDIRATPLSPQAVIQIDVGSPVVAFRPITFKVTGACGEGSNGCAVKKS